MVFLGSCQPSGLTRSPSGGDGYSPCHPHPTRLFPFLGALGAITPRPLCRRPQPRSGLSSAAQVRLAVRGSPRGALTCLIRPVGGGHVLMGPGSKCVHVWACTCGRARVGQFEREKQVLSLSRGLARVCLVLIWGDGEWGRGAEGEQAPGQWFPWRPETRGISAALG